MSAPFCNLAASTTRDSKGEGGRNGPLSSGPTESVGRRPDTIESSEAVQRPDGSLRFDLQDFFAILVDAPVPNAAREQLRPQILDSGLLAAEVARRRTSLASGVAPGAGR